MSIEDKHNISNNSFIICELCNKQIEKIDGRHLKNHTISFDEYRIKFPNSFTITKEKLDKELESIEIRKLAKEKTDKDTKLVKCYFCKKDIEVNKNQSNNESICKECKGSGLISPFQQRAIDSMRKSLLKEEGVDNASLIPSVVKKRNETVELKRQDPNYFKEIVEKRVNTMEENFGEDWKEKQYELSKEGMFKKLGVEYALQNEESVVKFKETVANKTPEEKKKIVEKGRDTKERNKLRKD